MADQASSATECQKTDQSVEIKTAYSSGNLPAPILNFNIGTILTYFIETRVDFRAIRENAFELFTSGHIQDIMVKNDQLARKVIIVCQCLAQMKTTRYRVVLMLNDQGDIIHGSCGCPAGAGPSCSCKHLAALCYTLEDFVKTFVLPEDIPSCTDQQNKLNKRAGVDEKVDVFSSSDVSGSAVGVPLRSKVPAEVSIKEDVEDGFVDAVEDVR